MVRDVFQATDATASSSLRRPPCQRCQRVQCICSCLDRPGIPLQTCVELLILQHPREQRAIKGTARLLHLCVAGSRLRVGERFAEAPEPAARDGALDLLLYPHTPGDRFLSPPAPLRALPAAVAAFQPDSAPPLRLVLVDATWRKSRRMLYESPWLRSLPRLALDEPPSSRYRIRRARGHHQRSSFEAAMLALMQLDHDPPRFEAAWPVFDAFVDMIGQRIGQGIDAGQGDEEAPAVPLSTSPDARPGFVDLAQDPD